MLRLKYLVTLCFVAIFNFSGVLQAQSSGGHSKVKFSCMLWEGPLKQELFYRDGDLFHPIEVYEGSRSRVHALEKSMEFGLYVKDERADDPENPYRRVGQSSLLEGTRQILFILFPKETDEGLIISILPVDDSLDDFPGGTFRFANFSNDTLFVKFADTAKKIPPREMTDMKSGVNSSGGLIPFMIGNEDGEKIYETRLFAQATGREIVFIGRPKVKGGLPSVRFLPQLLPQKLPSPK